MSRRNTDWIVVHCSATRPNQNIGAKEIRSWHKAQGWKDIGYHFVIRRDGTVEKGRAVNAIGSHVKGYNHNSVGICMVGGIGDNSWTPANNFTRAQWTSLKALVDTLIKRHPKARILGHRDFPGVSKACPCFDAKAWAAANKLPAAPTIFPR
jgi:N-acetylmuramoyl-L-alanine amidase